MCELFAANAARPQTLNTQLKTFFGDAEMHPHGWGLATRDEGGRIALRKGPERATDSLELAHVLAAPVRTSHALAHIRYATRGRLSYDNCHPFVGTDATGTEWSFIHNGSVFHPELIEPYGAEAQGQSDSERVLLYLLDALDRAAAAGETGFAARFDALAQALAPLSAGNKLNVILDDGTYTYIHTNTEDDTLFWRQTAEGAVLVCTRPLDAEAWQPVPKRRLLALADVRLVRASEPRGELYHLDEEELSAFLLANAA